MRRILTALVLAACALGGAGSAQASALPGPVHRTHTGVVMRPTPSTNLPAPAPPAVYVLAPVQKTHPGRTVLNPNHRTLVLHITHVVPNRFRIY